MTIKALYIKRPIKKSGEDFRKIALWRHKSFSISIISILICSRNNRGTAWSRNVARNCFWDCNWGRTGHGQLLVNSFPCLYLVTVPDVFAKVTRPSFLPSKIASNRSGLQFCKFFYSYFVGWFLPFSVVEIKSTEGYRLLTNNIIY